MVSVIIPVRNEEEHIIGTIQSIISQNYPQDKIEIIISDGKSTDTLSVIKSLERKIKIINNSNIFMPAGFNKALSECSGEAIIMVGGHCTLHKNFIALCVKNLFVADVDCVGGVVLNNENNLFAKALSKALGSNFGVGGVKFRKKNDKKIFVDTVAFGAYKRNVFELLGGLDEELIRNQDDEFNFRLIQNDMRILLDPEIISNYFTRNSILKLFKQYFQYGFFKIRVMQKRRGVPSIRHLIPGAFVFSILLSLVIFLFFNYPYPFIFILFMYFSSSILASLNVFLISEKHNEESLVNNILIVALLPLIYVTLHFSYGLGFIFGVFKFFNKWNHTKTIDINFNKAEFKRMSKRISNTK